MYGMRKICGMQKLWSESGMKMAKVPTLQKKLVEGFEPAQLDDSMVGRTFGSGSQIRPLAAVAMNVFAAEALSTATMPLSFITSAFWRSGAAALVWPITLR